MFEVELRDKVKCFFAIGLKPKITHFHERFLGLRGGPPGILPFLSPSAKKICITYMPYKSSEDPD